MEDRIPVGDMSFSEQHIIEQRHKKENEEFFTEITRRVQTAFEDPKYSRRLVWVNKGEIPATKPPTDDLLTAVNAAAADCDGVS